MKTIGLAVAVALVASVVPQEAGAYSGAITRAYADPTWTRGSLAGYVNWTDCGSDFCSWLPVATVQPTLPEYQCVGDEVLDSDPNTRQVWSGGQRTTNGTATFDLQDVPILTGVHGQRMCLSVIETVRIRDPVCVAQAPVLGMDPNDCPLIDQIVRRVIATTLLTVPTSQPPPLSPPSSSPPDVAGVRLSKSEAERAAKRALARRFGRKWKRGKQKRLACVRSSQTVLRCGVSWRYGVTRYKGRVGVSKDEEGITTRIRVKRRRS